MNHDIPPSTEHTSDPAPTIDPEQTVGPEPTTDPEPGGGITRRTLIGAGAVGAAAAVGAGLVGGLAAVPVAAAPVLHPAALGPTVPGLVYLPLDAFAFDVADTDPAARRLYQELTGMQPQPAARHIFASLPLAIGSIVKQINVGYQGQPIVSIVKRTLDGTFTEITPLLLTAAGGGPKTQTFAVDATLDQGATYAVRAFCSAGDSIYGVTVGYVPAAQAFVPFTGTTPRVLDTRPNNRFAANEERTVDLSTVVIPTARAAVINLTAVAVAGPGFLAAFADGVAYPGNSTVNFTAAGQTVANAAVVTMTAGKIKVRCGPAAAHVLVDVVGSLL